MAQANHTPIQLYHSTVPLAVPSSANMVIGELALNTVDGSLYYKDALGGVSLLVSAATVGSVTDVSVVSANGLAGTVATSTTTPAITLTTTVSGMVKANGTAFSAAVAGVDYAPPTSGSSILYGNGSGGFSNVTIGSGLNFAGGTLTSTGSGGTVTSVSVTSANGFGGTVANSTSTPAITLTTSVTGLLKGDGTGVSAATSGVDYAPATSGVSILYGDGSGGFSNVTINPSLTFSGGTLGVTPPTSGTSILKGNGLGGFANATAGTDYVQPSGSITGSAGSLAMTNWTVVETGGKLYFAYGGVNKASLDSSGNFVVVGNVTAYGTIT